MLHNYYTLYYIFSLNLKSKNEILMNLNYKTDYCHNSKLK